MTVDHLSLPMLVNFALLETSSDTKKDMRKHLIKPFDTLKLMQFPVTYKNYLSHTSLIFEMQQINIMAIIGF